jgi:hypothetical protein
MYGLGELKMDGDGACQFRALSDQLLRSPRHHKAVRTAVLTQLRKHKPRYSDWVPQPFDDYLARMAEPDAWGDHVTLQVLRSNKHYVPTWFRTGVQAWTQAPFQPPCEPTRPSLSLSLQAAADCFRTDINILTSFPLQTVISIKPAGGGGASDRVLWLSFWAEVHYNSIYPIDEVPRHERH